MNREKIKSQIERLAINVVNNFLEEKRFRYTGPYDPSLAVNEPYRLQIIPQKGTLLVTGVGSERFSSDIPLSYLDKFFVELL